MMIFRKSRVILLGLSVLLAIFFAKDIFADGLDDGKRLLLEDMDIVGAHDKFHTALSAAPAGQAENFWHAITAIAENDALKSKLRELGIFGADDKLNVFDADGQLNYNPETDDVDNIVITDDSDPEFQTSDGSWQAGTNNNATNGSYRWHDSAGSSSATWTFSVSDTSRDYLVYAKWPGLEGVTSSAQYTITPQGGAPKTITVDQQSYANGETGYCLGVFRFVSASGNTVRLDSSSGGKVVADAIRVVPCRPYPDLTEAQNLFGGTTGVDGMLTQIDEAIANLSAVTNTFSDTVTSAHMSNLPQGEDITLDYGDASMLKTGLYMLKLQIKLQAASEMDGVNIQPLIFGSNSDLLKIINDYTNLFKPRLSLSEAEFRALMGEAKGALVSGIDAYTAGSEFIRTARSDDDGLNHFISFWASYPIRGEGMSDEDWQDAITMWQEDKDSALEVEEYIRGKLTDIENNLTDHAQYPFVTMPAYMLPGDDGGLGININVDLYEFFTNPKNIRVYIDRIINSDLITDDFTGADIGGVLPGLTPSDWNFILGIGPCFTDDPAIVWNNDVPQVDLKWDASKDAHYANIARYEIWRLPSADATKVTQGAVLIRTITDKAVNTYTDSTVGADGDFYYYRLYTYYAGLDNDGTAETYTEALKATLKVYIDAAVMASDEDGSKAHPYKDLGDAIREASNGTRICVAKGIYHETDQTLHMWSKSGLILEGGYSGVAGNWTRDIALNETIIDGTGCGGWNIITFSNVTGGTLDGFTITGAFMNNDACAVRIDRSSSIVIKNCKIANNYRGIGIWVSQNCRVENCQITRSSIQGIQVDRSSLNISDSAITGSSLLQLNEWISGIDVYSESTFTAARLFVSENKGRGIAINSLSAFDVKDSVIANNLNRGFDAYNSYGRLFNNLIINNARTGVSCAGFDAEGSIIVEQNTIVGNGDNGGIYCWISFGSTELDTQMSDDHIAVSGNWARVNDGSANWGEYLLHEAGSGSDSVTWTPDIKAAGDYKVYSTWVGGAFRASAAPYEISYDGGTATVNVDQRTSTSGWWGQQLGAQYRFARGRSNRITLRQSPSGQVAADKVNFQYIPTGSETFTPVIRNNIIASNNGGQSKWGIFSSPGANPVVSYNDVWGNSSGSYAGSYTDGGGNISADPRFFDSTTGSYYLNQMTAGQATNSSCVDAGSGPVPQELQNKTTRSDGVADSGIVDMGYHYFTQIPADSWILNMIEMNWYENTAPYNSTGAAACQMVLNYIREGAGQSLLSQNEIYEYGKAPAAYGLEMTPKEVDKALGHFDPYDYLVSNLYDVYDSRPDGNPFQGYNYSIDTYNPASDPDAINKYMRDICHWMAFTVTKEDRRGDGELVARPNTPAVLPIYGSYANWVAVKGYVTSANPAPEPRTNPWYTPDFTVYGFWMKDPRVSGIGQNTYKTAAECQSTYFLPLATGDSYNGLFLQVAEPPAEMSGAIVEIPEPSANLANLDLIGAEPAAKDSGEGSRLIVVSSPGSASKGIGKTLIRKREWRDLIDRRLLSDPEAAAAFEGTKIDKPILVHRTDAGGSDYYLVPFNKQVNKGKPLTSAVTIIDARDGYFKEASWTKNPETLIKVNRADALRLMERYLLQKRSSELRDLLKKPVIRYSQKANIIIKKYAALLSNLKYAATELVWAPGKYSSSPYRPYWRVNVSGSIWYVTQDRIVK